MKKLLTLTALAAFAVSAFGQGQIIFQNRDTATTPPITAAVYLDVVGTGTVGALAGADYRAALLGGALGATPWAVSAIGVSGGTGLQMLASPASGATWVTFRTGAAAGYVAVGTDSARVVPGVDWNATGVFQMVAWSGGFNTWEAAVDAAKTNLTVRIGASNPLELKLPSGPTDPNITKLVGLQPFAIVQVPEPSMFALAGLGAAALMIFRRRK